MYHHPCIIFTGDDINAQATAAYEDLDIKLLRGRQMVLKNKLQKLQSATQSGNSWRKGGAGVASGGLGQRSRSAEHVLEQAQHRTGPVLPHLHLRPSPPPLP